MKAMALKQLKPIITRPLEFVDLPKPTIQTDEILIRVKACGICHTDLHTIEGELNLPKLPIVPGHQIAGIVEEVGDKVKKIKTGDKVGVPWVYSTCGKCKFCKEGKENLCDNIQFTGFHVNGGYAEYMVAKEFFTYQLPEGFSFIAAAPLLCAGIISYRALKLSAAKSNSRLGLYGFGASAHITLQIALHLGCEIYVFSRTEKHRQLAESLGAVWTGTADDFPPQKLDSAIIFAPAGQLVLKALNTLEKGGTLILAGIHMSPIPEIDYQIIYQERTIRSVANSTRQDALDLLKLAGKIPVKTEIQTFPLEMANEALKLMKASKIQGAGVLTIE
jgi:alcohol dehydrogenase, propanol-preferring